MKKCLFVACSLIFAMAVRADVLYWQINSQAEDVPSYDYAMIKMGTADNGVIAGGTYLWNYAETYADLGMPDLRAQKIGASEFPVKLAAILEGDYAGQSFVVELYNAEKVLTNTSDIYSLGDLRSYISSITDFTSEFKTVTPMPIRFSSQAVPEPTSGMLILLGSILLSLRRKVNS